MTPTPPTTPPESAPRAPGHRRPKILLLLFIGSPVAVVTVLVLIIIQAMKTGPYMSEPPKGAGAGHTGMYNEHMKSK